MEIHELRIGNYISFMEDSSVAKVTGIHTGPDGVDVEIGDEVTWIQLYQFEPIKLTEEILLKSGIIVKDDNPKEKLLYQGDLLFEMCGYEFSNSSSDGFYSYDINNGTTIYRYLHELQNLHYWFTKEELEVKI